MFERFTERARQVVVLGQDEARVLGHAYIGTEHILLGLLREGEGIAAYVLESLDVTADLVRAQVVRLAGTGDEVTTGQIPFSPRAKKVLEHAAAESHVLDDHGCIGTEHILLGVVAVEEGVGCRILEHFVEDASVIHAEVLRAFSDRASRASKREHAPARGVAIDPSMRAQTVGQLIDSVVAAKEAAIDDQEFERAAALRDLQRRLLADVDGAAKALQRGPGPPPSSAE